MFHKYTLKKQELIAAEFAKLLAFNFVGGRPNIKMVWTNVSKKKRLQRIWESGIQVSV